MQYQVPQFIEVEDKIVGPLSIKQFLYLAGAAGGVYLSFAWLPIFLGIIPGMLFGAIGVCLAFVRINNRPFISLVESAANYMMKTRLYVWKREEKKDEPMVEIATNIPKKSVSPGPMTHAAGNSLATLEWQIDTYAKAELQSERGV